MNLSLKKRVATSFIIANVVVLLLTFIFFHFFKSLNKDVENITVTSNQISLLTDEIRISTISILKYQRKILTHKATPRLLEKIIGLCESFISQLHSLDALYQDVEVKKVVAKMLSYVDSLKLILGKASLFHRDTVGVASISELSDKILEAFSKFQDIQYSRGMKRDKKIKEIINRIKRNMMITLIIGFLGTIVLNLVVPGKIALPFKKIKDAIRELQDCNFDVSIYYNQDDEIGEIASEMNKMIKSFKVFDELRTDRISVENRKFDALANLVKRPVLVANADNKMIYINKHLYSLLQIQSEDIIGKEMTDTVVPKSIMDAYELAIKRRSKIENAEVIIPARKEKDKEKENGDLKEEKKVKKEKKGEKGDKQDEAQDVIFKGHANVIPIRGKDPSLDYYLMVLSTELFSL